MGSVQDCTSEVYRSYPRFIESPFAGTTLRFLVRTALKKLNRDIMISSQYEPAEGYKAVCVWFESNWGSQAHLCLVHFCLEVDHGQTLFFRPSDLPLNIHPFVTRALLVDTPCGAVWARANRAELSCGAAWLALAGLGLCANAFCVA